MKRYAAELVELAFCFLCALTNHARGCWLLNNSPLRRMYWWAIHGRWDDTVEHSHHECPTCHFDRNQYVLRFERDADVAKWEREYEISEALRLAACSPPSYVHTWTSGGTTEYWHYDPLGGLRKMS
jgi:hypothetical protein